MKVIIIPDSFKGTLSASTVAQTLGQAVMAACPGCEIKLLPVADGGEGTLECFRSFMGGETVEKEVTGPNFQQVNARLLLCGETAVVETAQAAGLPLANPKDAKSTTTYGVGELICEAKKLGAKRIILGIGGSATNDCGCGAAAATGVRFFNAQGESFVPVGKTLSLIEKIDFTEKTDITVLCDVKNPLYGRDGAAYVFAPQKGAGEADVALLDDGMRRFSQVLSRYGKDVAEVQGAGAAGGMGAGMLAFFGATLKSGIDTVLEMSDFKGAVCDADVVITGEGCLDSQSFSGKVIDGVVSASCGKPVIAVVGISRLENPREFSLHKVFETNEAHLDFEIIKGRALEDLKLCAEKVAQYLHEHFY